MRVEIIAYRNVKNIPTKSFDIAKNASPSYQGVIITINK
jgi:hypothetical protein